MHTYITRMPVNWISECCKQTILGNDGNNNNNCIEKTLLKSDRKMPEKSPVATIQNHTFAVKYIELFVNDLYYNLTVYNGQYYENSVE